MIYSTSVSPKTDVNKVQELLRSRLVVWTIGNRLILAVIWSLRQPSSAAAVATGYPDQSRIFLDRDAGLAWLQEGLLPADLRRAAYGLVTVLHPEHAVSSWFDGRIQARGQGQAQHAPRFRRIEDTAVIP